MKRHVPDFSETAVSFLYRVTEYGRVGIRLETSFAHALGPAARRADSVQLSPSAACAAVRRLRTVCPKEEKNGTSAGTVALGQAHACLRRGGVQKAGDGAEDPKAVSWIYGRRTALRCVSAVRSRVGTAAAPLGLGRRMRQQMDRSRGIAHPALPERAQLQSDCLTNGAIL